MALTQLPTTERRFTASTIGVITRTMSLEQTLLWWAHWEDWEFLCQSFRAWLFMGVTSNRFMEWYIWFDVPEDCFFFEDNDFSTYDHLLIKYISQPRCIQGRFCSNTARLSRRISGLEPTVILNWLNWTRFSTKTLCQRLSLSFLVWHALYPTIRGKINQPIAEKAIIEHSDALVLLR